VGVKIGKSDAASVLQSFMTELRKIDGCKGVFYWEPEVYGGWKPAVYGNAAELTRLTGTNQKAWVPYDQGAFTADYRPSPILDCFAK
jgi:arabinogalactan endo-1,4-beta-galactosidase